MRQKNINLVGKGLTKNEAENHLGFFDGIFYGIYIYIYIYIFRKQARTKTFIKNVPRSFMLYFILLSHMKKVPIYRFASDFYV